MLYDLLFRNLQGSTTSRTHRGWAIEGLKLNPLVIGAVAVPLAVMNIHRIQGLVGKTQVKPVISKIFIQIGEGLIRTLSAQKQLGMIATFRAVQIQKLRTKAPTAKWLGWQ